MNHEHFMQKAIELAIQNVKNGTGGPFGAIIVKDSKIIAQGSNQVTSTNDPTAHAEIVAIRNACKALNGFQLTDCIVYSSCEPCPMCLGALFWARPRSIYFAGTKDDAAAIGFDDSFIYNQLPLKPEKRNIPCTQIMRDAALEAFKLWKESAGKIEY